MLGVLTWAYKFMIRNILVYTNAVGIYADNESNLQLMMNTINEWDKQIRIEFNNKMSNIVHCTKQSNLVIDVEYYTSVVKN